MRTRGWISGRPARFAGARRAAAVLLAAVFVVAGAGCDLVEGSDSSGSSKGGEASRRVERKAANPPPGLPAAFTAGQRLDWSACPPPSEAQGSGDAPGEGWECATMKAPLDYRRPGRDTIDVAMIRQRATGPEKQRIGSLLFNFGGPGRSGVVGLPRYADDYAPLRERYDLVSFDPRGVGGTAPVSCGKESFEGSEACEKHSGRLLPYVGTSHTARDLDLMRYLLGDEKLHFFGVSYGTALGGVYAHLFPENVGRLVLEAPVDPTLDRQQEELSQVRAVQRAFDRFAEHCADAYDDCPTGSVPAQAGRRVVALLDRLDRAPAPTGGGEKLDGDLAARAIANYLDRGEDGRRPLAKALTEVMERGTGRKLMEEAYDHAPGSRTRAGAGAAAGGTASGGNGTSAYVAITCADSNVRPGSGRTEEMNDRIEAASPVFGRASSGGVYLCYDWPFEGERATLDVSADGAAPILVVAGTGDPTTPYVGAERMARELGENVGVLLTAQEEGHGSYLYNRCVTKAVDTYLLDGTPPADAAVCPQGRNRQPLSTAGSLMSRSSILDPLGSHQQVAAGAGEPVAASPVTSGWRITAGAISAPRLDWRQVAGGHSTGGKGWYGPVTSQIDYKALFMAAPNPNLVLGPDLVIVDVNEAYLQATGRTRADLIGQYMFDAFPSNPADPHATGMQDLDASLHRILRTKTPDTMALTKYDIPRPGRPGTFEERWWSPINTPVLGPDGQVAWIIHRVEDVTPFILARAAQPDDNDDRDRALGEREAMDAELYVRARELQRLNEELRRAHARERQVAVTLQETMLRSPDLAHHQHITVRYLPASGSLNVCGDWYDVIDLPDNGFAVAVGDVVGHGLQAAATMGMLRSALSAGVRALREPGKALDLLDLYSYAVEGALATTAVKAVIDPERRRITYSSAGHLPPVLLHPDGTCDLLDKSTDPPLGTRPRHIPRPHASLPYRTGDTLVLYTDGLIERRGEDIDAGLHRLTDTLARYSTAATERLADSLLARLGVAGGARDDIALIIVRL